VHIGDGYLFVQEQFYKDEVGYDMMLVDAYDHMGMAESVGVQVFFDACAGLLTHQGVLSINLWGTNRPLFKQSMARINESFEGRSLVLPVEDKGNVICLATSQLVTQSDLKRLKKTVDAMDVQFQVNLSKSLHVLIRRNRPILKKLFI
jgi:spermidine synthase